MSGNGLVKLTLGLFGILIYVSYSMIHTILYVLQIGLSIVFSPLDFRREQEQPWRVRREIWQNRNWQQVEHLNHFEFLSRLKTDESDVLYLLL